MNKRRDFIKFLPLSIFTLNSQLKAKEVEYLKNNNLKSIKEDFLGNVYNEEFKNLYGVSGNTNFLDMLRWKFSLNPQKDIKENENYKLKVIENDKALESKEDYILWCGHATFLIQIDGKRILTDPCLTNPPTYKRLTSLPFKDIKSIKPDYLLVSHAHFDHLDSDTLKYFDKNTRALTPLKMTKTINSINETIKVQEAGWYQKYDIKEKFEIYFLPAHHWHQRSLADRNEILWGSFLIKYRGKTIYFAGDSGYSKHFKDIGKLFGSIDIAILPIGSYSPSWFMRSSHIDPFEALMAYKDLRAKEFIPMHFGTFDMTDEPLGEPEKILRTISKKQNVRFLDIGELYGLNE